MESIKVLVELEGKALQIILDEQSRRAKSGKPIGKERLINLLLTELHELRIAQPALSNEGWINYLKKK